MKNKVRMLIAAVLATIMLTACGEDPELVQFRKNVDDFCNKISEIDNGMNNIDAQADGAVAEFLGYLDELDLIFRSFANLDFPEEFDYLEATADEASQYMTTAVESYHEAYSNGSYNEYTADYAYGNYSRAYKRIQIIISFLHGETPDDVNIITDEEP
ncbi:MAG: hypothetical protein K2K63_11450 [Acetatifactor sp.]|nr:hypothetical protein [Acetatifactor sp.]